MIRHAQEEGITMIRSILIGTASFAITAALILGSGFQGSGLIG